MRSYKQLSAEEQEEALEQVMRALLTPGMIRNYPPQLRARLDAYAERHETATFDQMLAANEEDIRTTLTPRIQTSLRRAHFAGPSDVVIRLRSEARPAAGVEAGAIEGMEAVTAALAG
jgi:hypothetical protein